MAKAKAKAKKKPASKAKTSAKKKGAKTPPPRKVSASKGKKAPVRKPAPAQKKKPTQKATRTASGKPPANKSKKAIKGGPLQKTKTNKPAPADKPALKTKTVPKKAKPSSAVLPKTAQITKGKAPALVKLAPPKKPVAIATPVAPAKVATVGAKAAPPKPTPAGKPVAHIPSTNHVPEKSVVAKVPEKAPAAKAPVKGTPPAKGKAAKPKEPIVAVMTGVEPIGGPTRTLKRALKERYVLEFYMNATPGSLYDLISTPSGFSEWFCDDVDVRGDQYTFRWGHDSQTAQCLSRKFGELMRFQWEVDEDPGAFFELRIRIDPMTNETCLVVTDHAWPKDLVEAKALWESQIHTLQRVLGA